MNYYVELLSNALKAMEVDEPAALLSIEDRRSFELLDIVAL